jgi:hypothetical protein
LIALPAKVVHVVYRCSKVTRSAMIASQIVDKLLALPAAFDPAITLMKSRRRIAFPRAGTTPTRTRLQQGFAIGGMGSDRHFAQQQSSGPNVRFGSKADIAERETNVRYSPESGHR